LPVAYEADQGVYLGYSLVQEKVGSQILGTLPPYLASVFAKKIVKKTYSIIYIGSCSTIEQTFNYYKI